MYVRTSVVQALMRLRGHNIVSLSSATGTRAQNLEAWFQSSEGTDAYVNRRNQAEILRMLGIEGVQLRSDFVHHWKIAEKFGSRGRAFDDLQIALYTFGKAYAVSFHQMNEKAFSFNRKQFFALRFETACVLLEVETPLIRSSAFDAAKLEELEWRTVEGVENPHIVLLTPPDYQRMSNGDLTVGEFDALANETGDTLERWAKLHLMAREYDITADDVEKFITSKARKSEQQFALEMSGGATARKVANGDFAPGSVFPEPEVPVPPTKPAEGPLKRATASVSDISVRRGLLMGDPVEN